MTEKVTNTKLFIETLTEFGIEACETVISDLVWSVVFPPYSDTLLHYHLVSMDLDLA